MPLDVPQAIARGEPYAALFALLRDTFVESADLAERWRYSENHMSNMRRRGKLIPYTRLPSGRVLYRLSDIVRAEIAGTNGPLSLDRCLIFVSAQSWMAPADRDRLAAELRKAFG